jgi:MOSC domain-containing protein YiiM
LAEAVLDRDAKGNLIRKCGAMSIVLIGGNISVNDPIKITLPQEPHLPLEPVQIDLTNGSSGQ